VSKKRYKRQRIAGEKNLSRRGDRIEAFVSVGGKTYSAGTHATIRAAKIARAARATEIRAQLEQNKPVQFDRTTTFAVFATDWLRRRTSPAHARPLQPSTIRSVRSNLTMHLLPPLGDLRMKDLTPVVVEDLFTTVAASHAPKTRRSVFQLLRWILRDAVNRQVIAADPTANLPLPRVQRRPIDIPPPDVAARIIEAMETPYKEAALLAAATGLREGELLALRWDDIDVPRKRIRINKARDQAGTETRPKTDRSVRFVRVTDQTLDFLAAYRTRTQKERAEAIARAEECVRADKPARSYTRVIKGQARIITPTRRSRQRASSSVRAEKARSLLENLRAPHWEVYIFPACIASKRKADRLPVMEARNLQRAFQAATKAAGLTMRFHDLRHVWASVVLQLGGDRALLFVANNLGHAKPSFTLDTYSHVLPDRADVFLTPIDGVYFRASTAPSTEAVGERPETKTLALARGADDDSHATPRPS